MYHAHGILIPHWVKVLKMRTQELFPSILGRPTECQESWLLWIREPFLPVTSDSAGAVWSTWTRCHVPMVHGQIYALLVDGNLMFAGGVRLSPVRPGSVLGAGMPCKWTPSSTKLATIVKMEPSFVGVWFPQLCVCLVM